MKREPENFWSIERAKEIARRVLDERYDPLLACRDLADLRLGLQGVADEIMDTFIGIASEVDGVPLGSERQYWAEDALRLEDTKTADYRGQVRASVEESLRRLLVTLGEGHRARLALHFGRKSGDSVCNCGANKPLRDAGRLVSEYGGTTGDWAKITSTAADRLQTHAYRNVVTGEVVELKSMFR